MLELDLLELFDINEKKLKKKIVRGCKPSGGEYMMMVFLAIFNNKKELLLKKNVSTDKWGLPSIYIRHKKPFISVKEEIKKIYNIDIAEEELIPLKTVVSNKYLYKIIYLDRKINKEDIKMSSEAQSIIMKYFSMKEIERLIESLFYKEEQIIFIQYLKRYLNNQKI